MSYTINLTNGTEIIAGGLSDGAVDTSATSLTLIGKNYAGYGEFLNENLVHMLEHFAAGTGPANPLKGQLWWDTTNNILKVYSGVSWKISTGATSSPFSSPPGDLSALGGDLWFDSTNQQLMIYSGSAWVTVGPVATPSTGDTGAFPSIMTDTLGGSHIVTQIRIVGVPYVIISKDTFNSALAGFTTVKAGINFSTIASPTLQLSTQDISANPSTLVQRDTSGGINATTINSTTLTAGTVQATNIVGSLVGNVVGNISATSIGATSISTAGISASSGYTGTLLTAAQPNITSLGTLVGLAVNGTTALVGSATLNGSTIATLDDPALFTSINNTPIGNATPSTGAFTTLAGTLTTASQTAVTGLGNITTGTWSADIVSPTYGGTGVNNGSNTLTWTSNLRLNQNVEVNSSPTLRGTNFNSIPNSSLINSNVTVTAGNGISGGGTVNLGSAITLTNTGVTNIKAGVGISISAETGVVTINSGQNVGSTSSVQFGSLGVGTPASGTTGEIRATNNITAYYSSDKKFKENIRAIPNALDTVDAIGGKLFDWTDAYCEAKGGVDGYFVQKEDFGVVAQDVKAVFPQAVRTREDGSLAVDYPKLSALAFAAIVELRAEINDLKAKIK
jgi:hypothetical protein